MPSLLLSRHSKYYTRELRLKAYSQLLESYRSVTLDSLARAFGVTKDWLDALSFFFFFFFERALARVLMLTRDFLSLSH